MILNAYSIRYRFATSLTAILVLISICPPVVLTAAESKLPHIDFNRQIRPLLAKHCYSCHGPDKAESGLRLTDFELATKDAESGAKAIVPHDVAKSELIARIQSADRDTRMPPEGDGLSKAQVQLLTQWIEEGATYNRHWSFQPIARPALPEVSESGWANNGIDRFIQSALEAQDITPSTPADPRTLIRRLYYSVLGLPPSPQEVDEFVNNYSEVTYERLVDTLLADPRLGERWGRHWLDVVRYAETNSYERDGAKPNAWKYRDYVIQAFNSDKPYDQFIREQLAGDELDQATPETLTATGYYRLGVWDDEPADRLQARFDEYDDLVTVTGQGFLGLTLNCARCHDHKIDPILQKDYYQVVAFMRDVTSYGTDGGPQANSQIDIAGEEEKKVRRELTDSINQTQKQMREIEQAAIVKMPAPDQRATEGGGREKVLKEKLQQYLDDDQKNRYADLTSQKASLEEKLGKLPPQNFVLGLARKDPTPPQTFVLLRGSPLAEGPPVDPAFPSLVPTPVPSIPKATHADKSAGRRKVLADWIASKDNWFTARVIVNRIWQHHFGRGIVRSSNNFGQLGESPTHPELLDWLATKLIDNNWQMKTIHREILLSQTFRMSSGDRERPLAIDPANDLFWRYPMRRLSAEELRDTILATSGQLNLEKFGPSFFPKVADEVKASQSVPGQGWSDSSPADRSRRSVYIHIKRSLVPPELSVFDFPETDTSCEARFLTTQAAQALGLLNGLFVQQQSEIFAKRVVNEAGTDSMQQIETAIRLAYGRSANVKDVERAKRLFERLEKDHGITGERQLREYCLVLMNTNEYMYLD